MITVVQETTPPTFLGIRHQAVSVCRWPGTPSRIHIKDSRVVFRIVTDLYTITSVDIQIMLKGSSFRIQRFVMRDIDAPGAFGESRGTTSKPCFGLRVRTIKTNPGTKKLCLT